ncbi:MAG: hypothetical protein FJ038_13440 [Chloroflexi bacterium]|nr:hypothetical protein [Chloroflexota bacterium]
MRITLLGGAGLMGRATARDLLETQPDLELVLADIDVPGAERVADGLRRSVAGAAGRLTVVRADAADPASLEPVIRGSGAIINSAQYDFNLSVMTAALAARVPYVDLGGLFHVTRRQLPLGPDFEAAGVTAVIGMGSTPGVTNVQARHAAELLDRIDTIHIYNGNTPNPDTPSAWGYSIHTILDEVTKRPVVFRDGAFSELEPLAEPERFTFVDPIGELEVHHSLHSELASLPDAFADRGVREVFFKLNFFGYTPRALRQLKGLADAGFASVELMDIPDRSRPGAVARVRPRDALIAVLGRDAAATADALRARGEDPDRFVMDHEEVAVVMRGTRDGRRATVRVDTVAHGREDWGLAGGTLLTATPPGIVAAWLASGSLRRPGVHAPEAVIEPAALFDELAARGMPTTTRVEAA